MTLTDTAIKNTKPQARPIKLTDGEGLYLLLNPNGSKWWRLDYRYEGKRKTLSMGVYPDVPLKLARERCREARRLLGAGADPGAQRKAEKKAKAEAGSNTFEVIGREWIESMRFSWTKSYTEKTIAAIERHAFSAIGDRAISSITPPQMLELLKAIELRGTCDMAHRIQQRCGAIFRYAIKTGRATYDPTANLRGALSPVKQKHYAALTDPVEFAQLLRDIEEYKGEAVTKVAMQLLALTFLRTQEVRFAEWSHFDLDEALWRIPGEIMKMREAHIVPLSTQAIAVLKAIHPLTGAGRLVLPSSTNKTRPISENTVNLALGRMGYKGRMTGHGFRSVASTLLNEQGIRHDVIEKQLAHSERNAVRAAYNRAEYLPERRKMMQDWADYLDGIKRGAKVLPFASEAA